MDVAKQIESAIERLKTQKGTLEEDIEADKQELTELEEYMKETQTKIDALALSIENSAQQLKTLDTTIYETENGYDKLVNAGKTLMDIVSKNMEKLQPEKN